MADEPSRGQAHTVTEQFLEEAQDHIRRRHLILKIERAYLYRMRQFIDFDERRNPSRLSNAR